MSPDVQFKIGERVSVWWGGEGRWFDGVIQERVLMLTGGRRRPMASGVATILYDDGTRERLSEQDPRIVAKTVASQRAALTDAQPPGRGQRLKRMRSSPSGHTSPHDAAAGASADDAPAAIMCADADSEGDARADDEAYPLPHVYTPHSKRAAENFVAIAETAPRWAAASSCGRGGRRAQHSSQRIGRGRRIDPTTPRTVSPQQPPDQAFGEAATAILHQDHSPASARAAQPTRFAGGPTASATTPAAASALVGEAAQRPSGSIAVTTIVSLASSWSSDASEGSRHTARAVEQAHAPRIAAVTAWECFAAASDDEEDGCSHA